MKKKPNFYNIKPILEMCCQYSLIYGERSNGKSYSALKEGLSRYVKGNGKMAIIRRWDDDLKSNRGAQVFDGLVHNGLGENDIEKLTNGEWTGVYYRSRKWFLSRVNDNGEIITEETPFAYAFALTTYEHDKSTNYPDIRYILFDEFMASNSGYLPDEFIVFMNVLSTIIRIRTDVTIVMCGNTRSKYNNPYFREMGIDVKKVKQGEIAVFTYGDTGLRVAVEHCASMGNSKASNVYFAFENNPELNMIRTGEWEIPTYPHLPYKYKPKDIIFTFFIEHESELVQCEVINVGSDLFIYCHQKTTELQDTDNDLIYTVQFSPKPNYHRKLLSPVLPVHKRIAFLFNTGKVFYQDNALGELVNAYINASLQI